MDAWSITEVLARSPHSSWAGPPSSPAGLHLWYVCWPQPCNKYFLVHLQYSRTSTSSSTLSTHRLLETLSVQLPSLCCPALQIPATNDPELCSLPLQLSRTTVVCWDSSSLCWSHQNNILKQTARHSRDVPHEFPFSPGSLFCAACCPMSDSLLVETGRLVL